MIKVVDDHLWEAQYPAETVATLLRYGAGTFRHTLEFYEIRNPAGELVMTAGVALWSMVRPPEIWTVLAKPYFVNLRESLAITREAMQLPLRNWPGLVCDVLAASKKEMHFVQYLGWQPTGRRSLRPDGDKYIQFGVL